MVPVELSSPRLCWADYEARMMVVPSVSSLVGSMVSIELSSPRLRWADYKAQMPGREILASLKRTHQITVNYTCDVW